MKTSMLLFVASFLFAVQGFASANLQKSGKMDQETSFENWLSDMGRTSSPAPCNDNDKLPGRPGKYDIDYEKQLAQEEQQKAEEKKGKKQDEAGHKRLKLSEIKKSALHSNSTPSLYVVAKDGSGKFTSVQAAIDEVPTGNKQRVVIYVKKGIYREKILIPASKPFITLKGDGALLTYLEWNDTASVIGSKGKPLSTYGSASVAVDSDNFIAMDISFRNTAPAPVAGAVGKQAVAFRISGDKAAFYQCNFYGAQDTLYDRQGRHYYYRCYIEGSIDFIFGDARSLFVKCHLNSIANPYGSIAAQKRMTPNENTGYSFVHCIVTGSGSIYLGRSWGPYSRIVYALTYFDNIIVPQGWNDWSIAANDKTVFYGEYKCSGPGANRLGRVKWSKQLTKAQVKPFLHVGFINGEKWLPK